MVLSVTVAIVAALLLGSHASPLVRFLLWPLATAASVTWLQVIHRFCVAFGALGIENFGRLGDEARVDPGQRAIDRRRAVQVTLEGALIGLVVTIAIAAIPV